MKLLFTACCLALLICGHVANAQSVEQKLTGMGLALVPPTKSAGNYVKVVRTGNLLFLAGHISTRPDGSTITGKLGKDQTIEQGYDAAKAATVSILSTLKAEVGDLNRIRRIVKVTGFVNSTPDFTDQPKVVNGCSDLLVALFGEKGKHARSAVGMVALPLNAAVEIEMIVEIE
jgi:enamine deaminase RidA (YjgF/YER057c/UK114 family)